MTEPDASQSGFRLWMLVPALGAVMVLAVFVLGLKRGGDSQTLPSALLDKPVPEFTLGPLDPDAQGLSTADLRAPGVKLLNVWASWCGPCRTEHPYIETLAAEGVTIHGLNYKDAPENAQAFLDELGNPYTLIGADTSGRAGIEFGVYGVPETFVINGRGEIVYKHVGPIVSRNIETLRAAIRAAGGL